MHIEKKASNSLNQEFIVTYPASEFDKKYLEELQNIGKKARLDGFRPGKVPLEVLKKQYHGNVLNDISDKIINEAVQKITKDHKIQQARRPEVDIESLDSGQDFKFVIKIETLPEIELKPFNEIKLVRLNVDVEDAEVEKILNDLAIKRVRFQDLKKPRAIKKGDLVHFSEEASLLGKKINELSNKTERLELKDLPEELKALEKAFIGMSIGDRKDVKYPISANSPLKKYAGKEVDLLVEVTNIQERINFSVDDELAKDMSFENIDALRKKIFENLQADYKSKSRLHMKRYLLDAMAETYSFDLPEFMVEQEFKTIWQHLQDEMAHAKASGQKISEEDDKPEEVLKKEYTEIAKRRVRLGLVISKVSQENKIQVTEEELRKAVYTEALKYPQHAREVISFYNKNPHMLQNLSAPILEDKVVDFILETAKVTDKKTTMSEFKQMLREVIPNLYDEEEEDQKAEEKPKKPSKKASKESEAV